MIESEVKRERLLSIVNYWAAQTQVKPFLRDRDVPRLVGQILAEFYHVTLCCGHLVTDRNEVVYLELDEPGGKTYGHYCKDCALKYIGAGFAREYPIMTSSAAQTGNKGGLMDSSTPLTINRLLTDEEIESVWVRSQGCPHKEERMGNEIAKAQDSKTLRAVGGWLKEGEKCRNYIIVEEIETFLRGEMPDD